MGLALSFLGGAGTVTGSKYLLDDGNRRMLVDCGLFQGFKALRLKNWAQFPIDPRSLDAVILTHAHIDHSGYLPRLVKHGFKGRASASSATIDLCKILLPDAGYLQEKDAEFANRHGFSKHKPALPLFTRQDALDALNHLTPVAFDQDQSLPCGAVIQLRRSGHILERLRSGSDGPASRRCFREILVDTTIRSWSIRCRSIARTICLLS